MRKWHIISFILGIAITALIIRVGRVSAKNGVFIQRYSAEIAKNRLALKDVAVKDFIVFNAGGICGVTLAVRREDIQCQSFGSQLIHHVMPSDNFQMISIKEIVRRGDQRYKDIASQYTLTHPCSN